MNKENIVLNHLKKINKSRKIKNTEDCCDSCIFNMPKDEISSVMGVEKEIITDSCPATAYVLFVYKFISSDVYATVTNDIINARKNVSAQFINSLSVSERRSIIYGVQTHCASCYIGTKQKCYNTKVNKI